MYNEIVLQRECLDDIPFVISYKKDHKKKPVVILLHGFKGDKNSWVPYLNGLAEKGYYAVAMDNYAHGERKGEKFESKVIKNGQWDVLEIRVLIKKTADDVSTLITHLLNSEIVDCKKIALVGTSMGGFVSYKAMTEDDRISTICPIIASPYWDDIPEGIPAMDDEQSIKRLQEYSNTNSPGLYPEKFNERPILIQVGSNDKHFNVDRVHDFYQELLLNYYNNSEEKIKFIKYENVGHDFTSVMWEEVCRWIDEYLLYASEAT